MLSRKESNEQCSLDVMERAGVIGRTKDRQVEVHWETKLSLLGELCRCRMQGDNWERSTGSG